MNFNDNIDYAEVFGEDVSDNLVGNDADATADGTSVGENESSEGVTEGDADESADSSEGGTEGGTEDGQSRTPVPTDKDAPAQANNAQSAEDNARYAAARREAERQLKTEREKHERELFDVFSALGMTNPYTGKPVTNMAELEEYKKARADNQRKAFMEKNGLSETEYDRFVSELPEVAEAREAKARAEAERARSDYERRKAVLDEEIKAIGKYAPEIKSSEDLIKDESYEEVLSLTKRGYKLSDAYRIANFDKLTGKASASARQQVLNAHAGKEHLMQAESRGSGIESVPADVRQQYRDLNPDMSDEEIARDWARYVKQTRKK